LGTHFFLILLAWKLPITQLLPVVHTYWFVITFTILLAIIAMGQYVGSMFFVWFFAAMTGFSVLYSGRKLLLWILYLATLVFIGCVFFYIRRLYIVPLLTDTWFRTEEIVTSNSSNNLLLSNIITILSAFTLLGYFTYYKHKITEIQIKNLLSMKEESQQEKTSAHPKTADNEDEKFIELFQQIHVYMETHRPYINPEFTIHQLAHELNTNVKYINKAIRQARDLHFSIFINQYRIENVKNMMNSDTNKYTFEHIASASGFRNLSTFNNAFKIIEGMTPSEYYKKVKEKR
jgi:AraC-like DNA-binding protein